MFCALFHQNRICSSAGTSKEYYVLVYSTHHSKFPGFNSISKKRSTRTKQLNPVSPTRKRLPPTGPCKAAMGTRPRGRNACHTRLGLGWGETKSVGGQPGPKAGSGCCCQPLLGGGGGGCCILGLLGHHPRRAQRGPMLAPGLGCWVQPLQEIAGQVRVGGTGAAVAVGKGGLWWLLLGALLGWAGAPRGPCWRQGGVWGIG